MAHQTALFPPAQYRRDIENAVNFALSESIRCVFAGSVTPTIDLAAFRSKLATFDFTTAQQLEDTLPWLINTLECGLVHINHPRYFGLFNPTPNFPSQIADRITAAFNPQLATWTSSPAAVEIEAHVIQAVAARLGFPAQARGHFTSGGSEANYTAVIAALTRACPAYAMDGVRAFAGPPVFYVSRESHLAWIKIAHQAGIGRSAVRLVATDGSGRLDTLALQETLHADCAQGCVPFMIAATAGTTIAGMIDPLAACADIAVAWKLWFHVDAAWAGAMIASNRFRDRLAGIELADSVTIDAHKWLATTMGCGIFITRFPAVLTSAFCASTAFMPSNIADADPYVMSVQWSRRFLGLRLFLSLATAGWDGYGAHVEHSLSMIELLKNKLAAVNWITVNEALAGVICIVPPNTTELRQIVAHVLASGKAWVSVTVFEGREVIRACVTSGLTTSDDIADLVVALLHAEESILIGAHERG